MILTVQLARLARSWSDASEKIDGLSDVLLDLRAAFDRGVAIQSTFLSAKLLDKVDSLGTFIKAPDIFNLNPH
jgi:hypothetical protein